MRFRPHSPASRQASGGRFALAVHNPVLVGYDGSPASCHALAYGAGLARRLERALLVVHVAPLLSDDADYAALSGCPTALGRESCAAAWLSNEVLAQLDGGGLVIHVAGAQGHRGRTLRHVAELCRAEAVVLGSPRRRWFRPAGSLPAWLAGRLPCPVIIVP